MQFAVIFMNELAILPNQSGLPAIPTANPYPHLSALSPTHTCSQSPISNPALNPQDLYRHFCTENHPEVHWSYTDNCRTRSRVMSGQTDTHIHRQTHKKRITQMYGAHINTIYIRNNDELENHKSALIISSVFKICKICRILLILKLRKICILDL